MYHTAEWHMVAKTGGPDVAMVLRRRFRPNYREAGGGNAMKGLLANTIHVGSAHRLHSVVQILLYVGMSTARHPSDMLAAYTSSYLDTLHDDP
jgi:hypothetical protein